MTEPAKAKTPVVGARLCDWCNKAGEVGAYGIAVNSVRFQIAVHEACLTRWVRDAGRGTGVVDVRVVDDLL